MCVSITKQKRSSNLLETDICDTIHSKYQDSFPCIRGLASDKAICEEAYLDACANELHNIVVPAALQHSNLLADEGFPLLLEHLQSLQALMTRVTGILRSIIEDLDSHHLHSSE